VDAEGITRYAPIENYGVIGNMRTTAHICSENGSIDFMCYPRFDSPSVFARLLDHEKGGFFSIRALPSEDGDRMHSFRSEEGTTSFNESEGTNGVEGRQYYWPETNVLTTAFNTRDGLGRVVDCMPVVVSKQLNVQDVCDKTFEC
jgi:GH15 family glucan-1,4-alpha-glucosidase